MKIFDVNGKLVSLEIKQSNNPLKGQSKSELQTKLSEKLQDIFPNEAILEEFYIPGSKLSVDFFIPRRRLVYEADGSQHDKYSGFLQGQRTEHRFARQVSHDVAKERWAEYNKFKLIRIKSEKDIENLTNG
jgi:hypothetical protein